MTRKRNLVLLAAAIVAVALVAANGSFVRGLFGQRAMLSVGGQQSGQQQTMPSPQASTAPQTLPGSGITAANAKAATTVRVTADSQGERGYVIDARVVTKEGKPVASATVGVYDVVQLLGPREMLIGTAATDGQGNVELTYIPAQAGAHQIVARPMDPQIAATDGNATFDATLVARSTYARERLPLDRFSVNLPFAGEALLLFVWGLFAFVVAGSLIRIPRGAPRSAPLAHRAREI